MITKHPNAQYIVKNGKTSAVILPIADLRLGQPDATTTEKPKPEADRKSTRLNSSHT